MSTLKIACVATLVTLQTLRVIVRIYEIVSKDSLQDRCTALVAVVLELALSGALYVAVFHD